jgi:hypothetical protein
MGSALYLISYFVLTPLVIFLFNAAQKKYYRNVFIALIIVVLCGSITITLATPQYSNMNHECDKELREMKKVIREKGKTLIVSRLGLGYWISWNYNTLISSEEHIRRSWWKDLDNVYFLEQIKDKINFGSRTLWKTFYRSENTTESEWFL